MTGPPMDARSIDSALRDMLPGVSAHPLRVTRAEPGAAKVHLDFDVQQIRPGGTISGPTMMLLADTAMYAAILATVGAEWLAVTTDMTLHFLRRPEPATLRAQARILKLGRTLIVIQVEIHSEQQGLVAHVVGTYARPPQEPGGA